MAAFPSAANLQTFRALAAEAAAAAMPGTVRINEQDYDGMVITKIGNLFTEREGWFQARKITAEFTLEALPLAIVLDVNEDSRPIRVDLILVHDDVRYRLNEVLPHPSGVTVMIKGIEEHAAARAAGA